MRYIFLLPLLALAGCANKSAPDNGWMDNCERNFSYDSRESALCKERVSKYHSTPVVGVVVVDPGSATAPSEEGMHKDKGSS